MIKVLLVIEKNGKLVKSVLNGKSASIVFTYNNNTKKTISANFS